MSKANPAATLAAVTQLLAATRTQLADEIKKVHLTYKKLREDSASTSDYMCKKLIALYRLILELSATEAEYGSPTCSLVPPYSATAPSTPNDCIPPPSCG
eukprot:m.88925 g.88925  ORF g.88925 m.88925 type:complete len:100 (+) comp20029_c0_seq3:157-456(+)